MPVYNGLPYLKDSLDAVLGQSYTDFELLVLDDSSTDGSWPLLQDYARRDARMRIWRKPRGGNVPKSWNVVRPLLRGEFVFYLSQDDLLSPDCIERMISRQTESQADCVLPDMLRFNEDPSDAIEEQALRAPNADYSLILDGRKAFVLSLNWQIHGFALCRREFYTEEEFDENTFNSDEYVGRKIFLQSSRVAFSRGHFYYRRGNADRITAPENPLRYQVLRTNRRLLQLMQEQGFEGEDLATFRRQIFDTYGDLCRYFLNHKDCYTSAEREEIKALLQEEYVLFAQNKRFFLSAYRLSSCKYRLAVALMLSSHPLCIFVNRLHASGSSRRTIVKTPNK